MLAEMQEARYRGYVGVYTDCSKSENEVGSGMRGDEDEIIARRSGCVNS